MSMIFIEWQLKLGTALIATIRCDSYEFPWTYGKLINSPEFERFRIYFSDEDQWLDTPEFDDLCEEIQRRGKFVMVNTRTDEHFSNFRLQQSGDQVWFRYS